MIPKEFLPYRIAADFLMKKLVEANMELPTVGVICGSGLSELSNTLEGTTLTVKYSDIPGFPAHCTVAGHKGEIVFGMMHDVPACCFRGRFHSYEGHDMKTTVLPVTVMRCLRVKVVIVTNAAGGLNPNFNVGDVICVSDHLAIPQLAGKNPLVGPNDADLGPRFPPTSNAYSEDLRKTAKDAADEIGIDFLVTHGTYCFVSGPMYESKVSTTIFYLIFFNLYILFLNLKWIRHCFFCLIISSLTLFILHISIKFFDFFLSKAECRFLRSLGGDCVGMSTIPEVVTAHYCGMQVLCLSLITNKVVMEGDEGASVANHAEVLEAVGERSVQMQGLVKKIIEVLNRNMLGKIKELPIVDLQRAVDQHEREEKEATSAEKFGTEMQLIAAATLGAVIGSVACNIIRGSH